MSFDELNDEELMERIQLHAVDSNESSNIAERYFKELYRRFYSQSYSFCRYYGLCHDEALETIQDAFIKVFHYADTFQSGRKFKPWFFRILYNKINDKYNEKKRNHCENSDDYADFIGEESKEINSFQNREVLTGMIYRLPKYLKDVILLYVYQEMDYDEIAQTVAISSRHVRTRVEEAIAELKAMAGENHD